MTLDELKLYTVRVKDGSGCLFQPILNENNYTYILTAKHLFEGMKQDNDGNDITYTTQDGTEISVVRQVNVDGQWQEQIIPFVLTQGLTYFPHKVADAAILKIDLLSGFDKIISIEIPIKIDAYALYGFPKQMENNAIGNKDNDYKIRESGLPAQYLQNAQLVNDTLNKHQIEGMSGGGILSIQGENVYVIGIQSEMKHATWANGKICFVPMKYFSEIIDYEEYTGLLTKLNPPYVGNFDFLKDEAFVLKVNSWNENTISSTRMHLKNKAFSVIQSDITPIGIKELFENRLLIDENESYCLDAKNLWIAWLEFLTVMNIIKDTTISSKQISEVFNDIRLKYLDNIECEDLISHKLPKSEYFGLQAGATVFISTNTPPESPLVIPRGKVIDIKTVYDKSRFKTDKGIDPYTSFNFIHLDSFKKKCIIEKMESYKNLGEQEVLELLKNEYNALFN